METVLRLFVMRVRCLFNVEEIHFSMYKEKVHPLSIYNLEKELYIEDKKMFVLSAFPEFLFDYFKLDFWNSHSPKKNRMINGCVRR